MARARRSVPLRLSLPWAGVFLAQAVHVLDPGSSGLTSYQPRLRPQKSFISPFPEPESQNCLSLACRGSHNGTQKARQGQDHKLHPSGEQGTIRIKKLTVKVGDRNNRHTPGSQAHPQGQTSRLWLEREAQTGSPARRPRPQRGN